MHKHPSTVYRMRSRPGPIRFVLDGRRIYVELKSLEAFLSLQVPAVAVLETNGDETTPPALLDESSPALDPKNQGNDSSDQNEEQMNMPGRSGQRPLVLPRKQPCFVMLYYAF
jgi:hypothetical protein